MTASRALVDGIEAAELPVSDRGFAYGDGIFRTIRVDRGRCWLLERHLRKLHDDALRLQLPLAAEQRELLLSESARLIGSDSGTLRLVITRGSGPRGDRPPATPRPRRVLVFQPGTPPALDAAPRAFRVCHTPMPLFPALAGVKHLNRLPQVLARQECRGPEPAEGLMLDGDGRLVCGTMSNVFLRQGSLLQTPRLHRAGVAGIVRERLLEHPPGGIARVQEQDLTMRDLLAADEVFVTNAVIGLWVMGALHGADGELLQRWDPDAAVLAAALAAVWREEC